MLLPDDLLDGVVELPCQGQLENHRDEGEDELNRREACTSPRSGMNSLIRGSYMNNEITGYGV